jgi:hypothetical protein
MNLSTKTEELQKMTGKSDRESFMQIYNFVKRFYNETLEIAAEHLDKQDSANWENTGCSGSVRDLKL